MKPASNFRKKPSSKKSSSSSGEIRIIAGEWRGRKLKVHDKEGLRPTTDRLKETVFNWLMMDIRGAKVLDCFAGAGSLAFEAASRGAECVVCIEKDKKAAKQLEQNCQQLNVGGRVQVRHADFFTAAQQMNEPFDLVFIDPPFYQGMLVQTIQTLFEHKLINSETLVYVEQESSNSVCLTATEFAESFEIKKQKVAGQVSATLYQCLPN